MERHTVSPIGNARQESPLTTRSAENTYRRLSSPDFFRELNQRIPHAREFTFDVYTFKPDQRGRQLLSTIRQRATDAQKKGEPFISYGTIDHVFDPLHDNGFPTREEFRKSREEAKEMKQDFKKLEEFGITYIPTNILVTPGWASVVNFVHKNHNKLYRVVDIDPVTGEQRKTVYIGGVNIEDNNWIDYMYAVEGPAADVLEQHINDQYRKSTRRWTGWRQDYEKGKNITYTNADGTDGGKFLTDTWISRRATRYIHDRVKSSKDYAWRASPYFGLFRERKALIKAAQNGADARLVSAGNNTYFLYKWLFDGGIKNLPDFLSFLKRPTDLLFTRLRVSLIDSMTKNGVRIFLPPGMVHAKGGVVDDEAIVTSSNGSYGFGAGFNQEVLLASRSPSLVSQQKEWFAEQMQPKHEYRPDESAKARATIQQRIAGRRTKST